MLAFESNGPSEELTKQIEQVTQTLLTYHGLRVFTTLVVNQGILPRQLKDGHSTIHPLQTKRRFLSGQLPITFIQLDVDRTVFSDASADTPNVWLSMMAAYDRALSMQLISPRKRPQHSGIEMIQNATDERSNYDLSKFTNMVDIILWRTSLYPDENAFVIVNGSSTKPISWKKMNGQIAGLAHYLHKKIQLKAGEKVLLLLPFGIDLVRTLYACFVLGLVPVVCPEDCVKPESLSDAISDLSITTFLVNAQSEDVLKANKALGALLRRQRLVHVEKASKFSKLLGPESGYSVRSEWTMDKSRSAMILIHPSVNTYKQDYVMYGHDTIMAQCRTQKLTCQIKYQRPLIVTGLGGFEGLGLLHAAFCGVYVGKER